jgi:hypothetical protein
MRQKRLRDKRNSQLIYKNFSKEVIKWLRTLK